MPISTNSTTTIDLYALPMPMSKESAEKAKLMHTVLLWRSGFVLRRPRDTRINFRYNKPFERSAWNCIHAIALFSVFLFYLLGWWEKRMKGTNWEHSFSSELLLVLGGYCQHFFPFDAISDSTRTAHFTFFLYSYVLYSFYTSNLLSHLVNDKTSEIKFEELNSSNYNIEVPETSQGLFHDHPSMYEFHKNTILMRSRFVNSSTILQDLWYTKTAVFSDFESIYPLLKREYSDEQICQLTGIRVPLRERLYLMSSKDFHFREQFMIGMMRTRETGLLKSITSMYRRQSDLRCDLYTYASVQFSQITCPLLVVAVVYTFAFAVLFIERWYHERTRSLRA